MSTILLNLADEELVALQQAASTRMISEEELALRLIRSGLAADRKSPPRPTLTPEELESFIPPVGAGIFDLGTNPLHMEGFGQSRTMHEQLSKFCGVVDSGVSDLSTNPAHIKYLGKV